MRLLAPPPQDDLELLIREARVRQRKRRLVGMGTERPAVGSPPRCSSRRLQLTSRFVNAGAGNVTTGFTFTNTSVGACVLHGWPGLRLVMRGWRVIDPRPRRVTLTEESAPLRVRTVVLRPHGAASFDVGGIDQVGKAGPLGRTCSAGSRAVLVTPPATGRALRVSTELTYCGHGSLSLYPVAPGRFDRQWSK